ncbi:MAG: glycosyltransferase family 4 protein [Acidobacteriota bacterium]|nr:glycosyltransferase family 4 protein [Acidobacteriota bacterium]
MPRTQEFTEGLRFHVQQSRREVLARNARFLLWKLRGKLGLEVVPQDWVSGGVDRHEMLRSQCQVVFSHTSFPANTGPLPVVWQNSLLDPEMQLAYGISAEALRSESAHKLPFFERAAVVQVSSENEARRLERQFPALKGKFQYVPFFQPGVCAVEEDAVRHKQADGGRLRVLFVGNEARRKGLDRLLEAWRRLPAAVRQRVELTCVTQFVDGPVEIPRDGLVRVYSGIAHVQVMELMATAHVFAMPSRFESYGFVYVEAMACGTIPVVPNWEVQRELVDEGCAGCITNGESAELSGLLQRLVEEPETRMRLALAARKRFCERYAPEVVAQRYRQVFRMAMEAGA